MKKTPKSVLSTAIFTFLPGGFVLLAVLVVLAGCSVATMKYKSRDLKMNGLTSSPETMAIMAAESRMTLEEARAKRLKSASAYDCMQKYNDAERCYDYGLGLYGLQTSGGRAWLNYRATQNWRSGGGKQGTGNGDLKAMRKAQIHTLKALKQMRQEQKKGGVR